MLTNATTQQETVTKRPARPLRGTVKPSLGDKHTKQTSLLPAQETCSQSPSCLHGLALRPPAPATSPLTNTVFPGTPCLCPFLSAPHPNRHGPAPAPYSPSCSSKPPSALMVLLPPN